ncbi:MAG: peptidoglycan-associated lipoprotein Pal [Desulfobacterales bacterium]|uniref:Peptidoglycan-associated protein n=1 Tax=Candidatus Desulfatibia vada TaxID=2841696 RepID=A0A8J6P3W5_9BACT|nr:peptidoglycan-associated lipoprotein Pal [Candidatus Desulfatibia vada]MBL6970631.1 peptidoglycan-associated lipoprotein Pal [Desulfobacterales bacterium]
MLTASCTKNTIAPEPSLAQSFETQAAESATGKAKQNEAAKPRKTKQQQAIEEDCPSEKCPQKETKQENIVTKHTVINEDIYFEFDSSALSEEAQRVLQKKAAWLRLSPDVTVVIEGHCDDRGTSAYNFALGHRRTEVAKLYMTWLGISTTRLFTLSYGEERPAATGRNEDAWAKNRRAHFVIEE